MQNEKSSPEVVEIYYEWRRFFVAKKDSGCRPFEAFYAFMQARTSGEAESMQIVQTPMRL